MYTYKFVKVKHSVWTGKAKESIEDIIEEYASLGWRFSSIFTDGGSAKTTKIVFEKKVDDAHYDGRTSRPLLQDEDFV